MQMQMQMQMQIEMQIEMQMQMQMQVQVQMHVQMAPQLHTRVWCGAAVWVHGGTWGCDPATRSLLHGLSTLPSGYMGGGAVWPPQRSPWRDAPGGSARRACRTCLRMRRALPS